MTERNQTRVSALVHAQDVIRKWRHQYGDRSMAGAEASAGIMVRLHESVIHGKPDETWQATIGQAKTIVQQAISHEQPVLARFLANKAIARIEDEICRTRKERSA